MEPLVGIGTKFNISGHIAKVTAIQSDGVECEIEGERRFAVSFEQIEMAVEQAAEEVAEKPKAKPRKRKKDADRRNGRKPKG